MLRRKFMATANTISKKLVGFLKPVVAAALQGLSKTDMDEVEFALDAMYMAITTPPEKDEDGNITHDEGVKHLQVLLANLDSDKSAEFILGALKSLNTEENGEFKVRFEEVVMPVLQEKFGPSLVRILNIEFVRELRKLRAYAINPDVVDEIIEGVELELVPEEFQKQLMRGIRSRMNITDPFGPATEGDAFPEVGTPFGKAGEEGPKVKIGDPFQHENIDGKDTPSSSLEDEDGSSTSPGGPVEEGHDPGDDDEEDNNQMSFNAEAFKAQCTEASSDQIKAGLGDKASDDIKVDKWTCTSKEQAAQYNNGAKRHFLPRFNEGSTYVTLGAGLVLGVGGTLVAQSLYSSGEVEEDVSNVTPMRGRKTG